ncbi:hypothetical protein [Opacimonas viscosa]|uniref:Uncharacterized protein n=1 Tax=Opacimonas viscosa TaxID=2961944 RepID=A0AA42BLM7_9ALTE|nr:hypothetical protein [Opacimonas viscosa]MCP3429023.1 hypothetical protein [Opacimonas viscosa]
MSILRALFGKPLDCDPYSPYTVDGKHPTLQRQALIRPAQLSPKKPSSDSSTRTHLTKVRKPPRTNTITTTLFSRLKASLKALEAELDPMQVAADSGFASKNSSDNDIKERLQRRVTELRRRHE